MHLYRINRDFQGPGETLGGGVPGAIAGSLLGAGAQFYDVYQRSKDVKRQIAAQKAESELAYQRSMEMWNAQNMYNSPQQQMLRFGAAGLNPHLIYGQGSSGQAGSPPQYQPPNIQMMGASPAYGAGVGSILPTLMAVGSWVQNMRQTEVDIASKQTGITKAEQLIDYLYQRNPQLIQELDQRLSLFPYQKEAARFGAQKAALTISDMAQEHRFKFGEQAYRDLRFDTVQNDPKGLGGMRQQQFLQQIAKTKLESAKASWTDYGVTNPQAIIQLVLSGVMGMAGQQLRFNQKARNAPVRTAPRKITTRFNSAGRRVYQRQE